MLARWRAFGVCLVVATISSLALPTLASKLTARDVTVMLFKASTDHPPDLSDTDLSSLDLSGLNFKGANLADANLYGADLTRADLSSSRLAGARLDRATIIGTNFSGADLSHASILRPNISETIEVNVSELPSFTKAKMTEANISGSLSRIDFKSADLTGTFFGPRNPDGEVLITPRIDMISCDFTDAILHKADLSLNDARYAKFVNADLRNANLAKTNLTGADFSGADVTGADFTGAIIDEALFKGTKGLGQAKGIAGRVP
jgi:uncharacterized protein YjbI with pentapeptide repeats